MELANNKKLTPTVVKRLEKQLITLKLYYMQENPDDIAKKLDISNRTVYNYYDQRSKIIKEAKLFTTPDPIILALLNDLELLIPPKALNQDQSQQAEKIDSEASSSNVQEPNLIKEGRQIQSTNPRAPVSNFIDDVYRGLIQKTSNDRSLGTVRHDEVLLRE
ncbi:GSCOCG00000799001-RA-CDS [Cotesia congregata]|nr:GSCOCG00000799001-RA-CDS [Cotesia congregata]